LTGATVRQEPAIQAWQNIHPDVRLSDLLSAGDGRITVGSKATDNGDGTWHYEYAVYNMNSHRSAGVFSVPIPAGANPTNVGFHAPAHHSGEPYSTADWTSQVFSDRIEWASESFATNPDANALRWGTLYNFRFDSVLAPQDAQATVTYFRPGSPTTATASVHAPGDSSCLVISYCSTSPNSVGAGALIAATGSTSVSANDFGVASTSNPTAQFGVFFMGTTQTSLPFGNGLRCAGGSVTRYSLLQTDGLGGAALAVDNSQPPALGKIVAGSSWNWQWWYRDPMGGGAAFNTSDALNATYCP
jgi:hypothetical protein